LSKFIALSFLAKKKLGKSAKFGKIFIFFISFCSANASIKLKNKKGETPYDLAMLSDNGKIINLFNQHQGKLLLKKHIGE